MIEAFIDGLITSPLLVCLALAYGLVYGLLGVMDLTLGARVAMAGYGALMVAELLGVRSHPLGSVALWLGSLAGALLLATISWWLLAPLRKVESLAMLVGSLGLSYALVAAFQAVFGPTAQAFTSYPVEAGVKFLGTSATPLQLVSVLTMAVTFSALAWLLTRTRLGMAIEAVAADPELARTVFNIDRKRIEWVVVLGSSAVIAPVGFLYAVGHGVEPSTGSSQALLAFVCTIATGKFRPLWAGWTALGLGVFGSLVVGCNVAQAILLVGSSAVYFGLLSFSRPQLLAPSTAIRLGIAVVLGLFTAEWLYGLFHPAPTSPLVVHRLPSAFKWFAQFALLTALLIWRSEGLLARTLGRND